MGKNPATPASLVRAYNVRTDTVTKNRAIPFPKLQEAMNKADYTFKDLGDIVHRMARDAQKDGSFEKWGLKSVKAHPDTVRKICKNESGAFLADGSLKTVSILMAKALIVTDENEMRELFMTKEELAEKQQLKSEHGQQQVSDFKEPHM
jgi:hypothetical protein